MTVLDGFVLFFALLVSFLVWDAIRGLIVHIYRKKRRDETRWCWCGLHPGEQCPTLYYCRPLTKHGDGGSV